MSRVLPDSQTLTGRAMSADETDFEDLMSRVRAGDQDAATELVRQYEPEVRRFIRFRLSSPSIRRFVDSLDISQSVMAKFFVQMSEGNLELNNPAQLRSLLLAIARNNLYDQVRRQHAGRRDGRRLEADGERKLDIVPDAHPTPSNALQVKELVGLLQEGLSDEERLLVDQRLGGKPWLELADDLGSSPDALRKRMARALDRVSKKLGLIENESD